MKGLKSSIALTLMLGLATPAAADEASEDRLSLGIFTGWNILSDELELGNSLFDDQVPESGILFGARVGFVLLPELAPGTTLAPRLLVEGETKITLSSTAGSDADNRASNSSPVLGWRAHLMLDLMAPKVVQPFVLLGIGGETAIINGDLADSPDTDAAFHWGAGARFRIRRGIFARLDYRQVITAGRFDFASINHEFHAGIGFHFGVGSSEPEREPEPEPEPEPVPQVQDTDGDGINDEVDKCPQKPEIVNNIDDEDGCPEVDSDGDGLLGSADQCPEKAEDKDGFKDEDGCPDLDNDADGIADTADKCPLKPESKNGYQDSDGCPDEIPKAVQAFQGTIDGIRFRSGRSTIVRSSRKILDEAVSTLKAHPSVRIEISGHTDTRGKREKNLILSRKRADAVKWYLVDKGVDTDRVVTVGYGPDKPVADNKTRKGRSQNRRIEFRILLGEDAEAGTKPGAP